MFDHVTIRVTDRDGSERFYDTVLTELGIDRTYRTGAFSEWGDFLLTGADGTTPAEPSAPRSSRRNSGLPPVAVWHARQNSPSALVPSRSRANATAAGSLSVRG